MSDVGNPVIEQEYEKARKDLLDLGLRNRLLNHRLSARRELSITSPGCVDLFDALVKSGSVLQFVAGRTELQDEYLGDSTATGPTTGDATAPTPSPVGQLPAKAAHEGLTSVRSSNRTLIAVCDCTPAELEKRFTHTYRDARLAIEETGVNMLHLAVGMLEWYEASSSSKPRYAPLVLVPVELNRSAGRGSSITARWTEDELLENLSLFMKLQLEFGIDLPRLPEGDPQELDIAAYLDAVRAAVSCAPRFTVHTERSILGLFSYTKFVMYKDLDPATWPKGAKPTDHRVARSLLGNGFGSQAISDPSSELQVLWADSSDGASHVHLDRVLRPVDSYHVVDADSSQAVALLKVRSGLDLVIQGPPGTGKSQTITNLIAEAVAEGKTVLFVAEKMAALEVVKRRLDAIGLGDCCLELHSNKSNKRQVLGELERVMNLDPPTAAGIGSNLDRLEKQRELLNRYCEAVNVPIGESGLSAIDAEGIFLKSDGELRDLGIEPIDLRSSTMLSWTRDDFERACELVRRVEELISAVGPVRSNPLAFSERRVMLPSDRDQLRSLLGSFRDSDKRLRSLVSEMMRLLPGRPSPRTSMAAAQESQLLAHLSCAPDVKGLDLTGQDWRNNSELRVIVDAGKDYSAAHAAFDEKLLPQAWEQEVSQDRGILYAHVGHRFPLLCRCVSEFRRAVQRASALFVEPSQDTRRLIEALDAIATEQAARQTIGLLEDRARKAFGEQWHGLRSDWEHLEHSLDWLEDTVARTEKHELPADVLETADRALRELDRSQAASLSSQVGAAVAEWEAALDALLDFLQIPQEVQQLLREGGLGDEPLSARFDEYKGTLEFVIQLNKLIDEGSRFGGLERAIVAARTWESAPVGLLACLKRSYAQVLLDDAYNERPELALFDADEQERLIADFQHTDRSVLRQNRARVLAAHWKRIPKADTWLGEVRFLRHEMQKRRRHAPVRVVMHKATNAVLALKPVVMMSPLSVATYLPRDQALFDLVIFDEASQVKPVDAFGAILRGRQLVVVGDSNQLPPTSFFDVSLLYDDDSEETATRDIESILSLMLAQGAPSTMLRWHYRSRHHSLIAVSNQQFYDNRLIVFPSPGSDTERLGLVFHHLPDAFYDRGGSRTNDAEARVVAEAVVEHALRCPHLSLGVAAFSSAQAEAIYDQVESLRRLRPEVDEFFTKHPNEPFFVKNLENVQGDERDVIFISIGYGRSQDGSLAMNFGPLNSEGGWRRLNVLITRARMRCEVFSSITADDIDLSRTSARGVQALATFLRFAKEGVIEAPAPAAGKGQSPFEDWVAERLREDGYVVDHQVGVAGFFIDLAIRDPERPGAYLLGIECDGASYHSARWARDRDRLRQEILEGLGWRLHRIWSTQWFKNPDAEYSRLIEAIREAENRRAASSGHQGAPGSSRCKEGDPSPPPGAAAEPEGSTKSGAQEEPPVATGSADGGREQLGMPVQSLPLEVPLREAQAVRPDEPSPVIPYTRASLPPMHSEASDFVLLPTQQLADMLAQVVQEEGPIHIDVAFRRLASAAGILRVGHRIRDRLFAVVNACVRQQRVDRRGEFLWPRGMPALSHVRDRLFLPEAERKIEHVPPEEIAKAVEIVLAAGFSMDSDELAREVAYLLGFRRVGHGIRSRIESSIEAMLTTGRLAQRDGLVYLTPPH